MKWDLNAIPHFIETPDRIRRSSLIDATKDYEADVIPSGDIAERCFTLFISDRIRIPKLPEEAVTIEPPTLEDWIVNCGEEGRSLAYIPANPAVSHDGVE